MSDYAIGDVQGCYEPLVRLLEQIRFNEHRDRLWFVGDLVNRGPQSLQVLRLIKALPVPPRITLGNHDLHLLSTLFGEPVKNNEDDTLHDILIAEDGEELGHWLRNQSILHYDETLNVVMCHAGIAPMWDLKQARRHARELEQAIAGPDYREFFSHMYGNHPDVWSDDLAGMDRLRVITNYFTRMRFCDVQGRLILNYKGTIAKAPPGLMPWFAVPGRLSVSADVVFGHWAALQGQCPDPRIHAIDGGCLWGGELIALRLQDRKRFAVPGLRP
ncbi:symmetrical bis(5'-nucleosyl)-tetraphosphatase [Legionella spiritensis]|uniref:Bis(5'-nucleosyl)-tetraphosphatase, symmetrical n=1 Tax=Legionella spiritensis TaxID=452 RepID=A0A0W0ZB49_LEGSP|nr:symmetrical bis(5'-nucleosyl)-tetraphosphatase [Legionella spiritensis]KTD66324.1 bis(5'-nucleosyl)-tetraphosphatase [Legionella spiritensis]SNV48644.1 bis(5'-nucleosyl)-tetraphosphatase [Legionella spiritensis]